MLSWIIFDHLLILWTLICPSEWGRGENIISWRGEHITAFLMLSRLSNKCDTTWTALPTWGLSTTATTLKDWSRVWGFGSWETTVTLFVRLWWLGVASRVRIFLSSLLWGPWMTHTLWRILGNFNVGLQSRVIVNIVLPPIAVFILESFHQLGHSVLKGGDGAAAFSRWVI